MDSTHSEVSALLQQFSSGAQEVNFDGLVGPTHHYAAQSFGNEASMLHGGKKSSPKTAALQGLHKAASLRDLGLLQGMLPPVRRPKLEFLYELGFRGTDAEMIEKAYKQEPKLISALYSASSMWVANAGTFSPAVDSEDGLNHFTAANLSAKFHRSVESISTERIFRQLFSGPSFSHHAPVPAFFGDEGAANHGRLCDSHGEKGLEVFVYGGSRFQALAAESKTYPSRQMLEASQTVARNHLLSESGTLFLQQNPEAIDAGVFHNDVTSVMNEHVFFLHEKSFIDQSSLLNRLNAQWKGKKALTLIEVKESDCALKECVRSYLFNSQLVTLPSGKMLFICPQECEASATTKAVLGRLTADYASVLFGYKTFPLKESMQNGGGPACLRLRMSLRLEDAVSVKDSAWLTPGNEMKLKQLVETHYRDELHLNDLCDPKFLQETQAAFDALEEYFGIGL